MKKIIFFSLIVFSFVGSYAQDNKPQNKIDQSYFKTQISYLSNSVYNGRQDSAITPYITPLIGYFDKSGFYVNASLSYLSSTTSRIDLGTLDIGYNFNAGDNFSGGIYFSKYFYSKNSTSIKSQMTSLFGANATYDASFLSFSGGIDLGFSSQTDIMVNYGISHPFYLGEDKNQWTIEPSIIGNAGTQNFYADNKSRRRNILTGVKVQGASSFNILDYEFSLPVSYDGNKWGLYFTPTYALPLNPVSATLPYGSVYIAEILSNVFYAELGIYFKL